MSNIPKIEGVYLTGMRLVYSLIYPGGNADELTDFEISQRLTMCSVGWKTTSKKRKDTAWYIDAAPYIEIVQNGTRQKVLGRKYNPNLPAHYYFVYTGGPDEPPRFYRVPTPDLQDILMKEYCRRLERHKGIRPRNPYATTLSMKHGLIEEYLVKIVEPNCESGRGDTANWSPGECLLAIWAYSVMSRDRTNIVKQDLYREVALITGRTEDSVEYKVRNVAICDARPREEKPITGAGNVQGLLRDLFNEHGNDYDFLDIFHRNAAELHEMGEGIPLVNEPDHSKILVTEGDLRDYVGYRKTRSAVLRKEARKHFRGPDGRLACCVCGACFDEMILEMDTEREIIQMHHLKPISEQELETVNLKVAMTKIAPLCPTCHALIHLRRPMFTLDEAKDIRKEWFVAR